MELRMDMSNSWSDPAQQPLTPRQDRLERAIVNVLRANGTRSELREVVDQLAALLHVQGISADRAEGVVRAIGTRATPFMSPPDEAAVGDSAPDRIAMMVRWCHDRYYRDD